MKTFYSIIYIPLNAALDEKVSIGLIMFDDENDFFKISESKLHAIRNLISVQNFTVLKTYFKSLDKEINKDSDLESLTINAQGKRSGWIRESYMSYLHKYANNMVTFSEVKSIEIPLNSTTFRKIFEKYIFQFAEELEDKTRTFEEAVEIKLYPKIESRVNLHRLITPSDFDELITPVEVDFIGKNGVIVAGQTMDFSKRLYNLENDLNKYITFTKAADYQDSKRGHYFIVGQEPPKEQIKNHKTWKYVKSNKLVDYVDFSEVDKIKDYMEDKGVTPYFEKEASN